MPSQADIHAPWGGVVPTLAMEAHAAAIDSVVDAALAGAGIGAADLDAVAVTVGPGLSLCLRVRPGTSPRAPFTSSGCPGACVLCLLLGWFASPAAAIEGPTQ